MKFSETFLEMAPYLLFGFAMAGLLSVLISERLVRKHLGGHGLWSVLKASCFGVPLPLCSCGVVPVAAALRRQGAGKGATTAFLISTPQTGVDSIMVTLSLLGPVFAIFRPVAAFVSGVIGGAAVNLVSESRVDNPGAQAHSADEGNSSDANGKPLLVRALAYGFLTLPRDIGRPLLAGVFIAGLISVAVPTDFLPESIRTGIPAMLLLLALGVPMYVCATASIPIAAALLVKGVAPGAVLVFLMTGPATNAATLATLWKLLGKKTTVIYLLAVAATAMLSGLLLDGLFASGGYESAAHVHRMLPFSVKLISALILLAVLAYALLFSRRRDHLPAGVPLTRLKIEGMTCSHCAESVKEVLSRCSGVTSVAVSQERGEAVVAGKRASLEELVEAVAALGYTVSRTDTDRKQKGGGGAENRW
ncbi:MAG: SO_0444 family Cu/Zn efflux transporter [Kiritimatiellia bacterium]